MFLFLGSHKRRVDSWWKKSSVPDKYKPKPKPELEKVKELLEVEETH